MFITSVCWDGPVGDRIDMMINTVVTCRFSNDVVSILYNVSDLCLCLPRGIACIIRTVKINLFIVCSVTYNTFLD